MDHVRPHTTNARRRPVRPEGGFSLVEAIIAMFVVGVAVSGAALAVTSADRTEFRSSAIADHHAIAERAIERAGADLTARANCDDGGWDTQASSGLASPAAPSFGECLIEYDDMVDENQRRYLVDVRVTPVDADDDRTGSEDADSELRDFFDASVTVELATDSTAGLEGLEPLTVGGSVDWTTSNEGLATVVVTACGLDRPDYSLSTGQCAAGSNARQPLSGVQVKLVPASEPGNTATAKTLTTSGGTAVARGQIEPGAYDVVVTPDTLSSGDTFDLFKADPGTLRVTGSNEYRINVTYVRRAAGTQVCTQVYNDFGPSDWDNGRRYEVTQTNMHYRRAESAAYITKRLGMETRPAPSHVSNPGTWMCAPLQDPLGFDTELAGTTALFRGSYDIEVEQARSVSSPAWGLRLSSAALYDGNGCGGVSRSAPLSGGSFTALTASEGDFQFVKQRSRDAQLDRDLEGTETAPSWYGRFNIVDSGAKSLCLRFYSKPYVKEYCPDPDGIDDYALLWPGCFYAGTTCSLPATVPGYPSVAVVDDDANCFNGADICVANCDSSSPSPGGTVGPTDWVGQAAGYTGGPNDQTVGCYTKPVGYAWTASRLLGQGPSTNVPEPTMRSYDWVGGDWYYYGNFDGRHAATNPPPLLAWYGDRPVYNCDEVAFSVTYDLRTTKYPYWTCLEARAPNGNTIRGLVLDQSGGTNTLYPTIAGVRALAPDPAGRPSLYWNGWAGPPAPDYGTQAGAPGSWPTLDIRVVSGDPVCDSGGTAPVVVHVDPILVDVYIRFVDDPAVNPAPPRPALGNLRSDRVSL